MVDGRRLQGVLFDSGDVLIRPIGGRWNPRYDFEGILLAHHPDTQVERFPGAFAAGQRALDAGTTTANLTTTTGPCWPCWAFDAPSTALLQELEAPAAGPVVPDPARPGLPHCQRVYIHQLPQTAPRLAGLIEDVYGPAAREA